MNWKAFLALSQSDEEALQVITKNEQGKKPLNERFFDPLQKRRVMQRLAGTVRMDHRFK